MGACILRVTSRVMQQCERVSVFSFFLFFYIFRLLYEILYIYNEAKDVNNNRFENCVIMYIHHVLHIYSYIYSYNFSLVFKLVVRESLNWNIFDLIAVRTKSRKGIKVV